MTEIIECIYDGDVIRPLKKPDLHPGEHFSIAIQKRIRITPIRLPDIITDADIEEIRNEKWASF